jgi:hypothetical protein
MMLYMRVHDAQLLGIQLFSHQREDYQRGALRMVLEAITYTIVLITNLIHLSISGMISLSTRRPETNGIINLPMNLLIPCIR